MSINVTRATNSKGHREVGNADEGTRQGQARNAEPTTETSLEGI